MPRRYQKNVTISHEQAEYVKSNYGKMSNAALAKMLGLPYNKTLNNLKVMGLHVSKEKTQRDYHYAKIINFQEYFDVDVFGKFYEY